VRPFSQKFTAGASSLFARWKRRLARSPGRTNPQKMVVQEIKEAARCFAWYSIPPISAISPAC